MASRQFRRYLRMAVKDELSAIAMYSNMANMVRNRHLKAVIMSIAGDEANHARTWMTMQALMPRRRRMM